MIYVIIGAIVFLVLFVIVWSAAWVGGDTRHER